MGGRDDLWSRWCRSLLSGLSVPRCPSLEAEKPSAVCTCSCDWSCAWSCDWVDGMKVGGTESTSNRCSGSAEGGGGPEGEVPRYWRKALCRKAVRLRSSFLKASISCSFRAARSCTSRSSASDSARCCRDRDFSSADSIVCSLLTYFRVYFGTWALGRLISALPVP